MTGLRPPNGVAEKRAGLECCPVEWEIPAGDGLGHVLVRVHRPIAPTRTKDGRPAYVEMRTGPASYGPNITDPTALRRLGWALLSTCQTLADVLEALADPAVQLPFPPDPEPTDAGPNPDGDQTTLFDQLVAHGLLPAPDQPQPQETRP